MGHNLAAGIQFVNTLGQLSERNQIAIDVADLVFMRLANVEHEQVFAGIKPTLQFFYLNFRNCCFHWFLLTTDSAKFVIVDQLRDGRMSSAYWAIGIFAQLEFAELHIQGIDQQQAANQGLAFAQDELDDLRRLHHAD